MRLKIDRQEEELQLDQRMWSKPPPRPGPIRHEVNPELRQELIRAFKARVWNKTGIDLTEEEQEAKSEETDEEKDESPKGEADNDYFKAEPVESPATIPAAMPPQIDLSAEWEHSSEERARLLAKLAWYKAHFETSDSVVMERIEPRKGEQVDDVEDGPSIEHVRVEEAQNNSSDDGLEIGKEVSSDPYGGCLPPDDEDWI